MSATYVLPSLASNSMRIAPSQSNFSSAAWRTQTESTAAARPVTSVRNDQPRIPATHRRSARAPAPGSGTTARSEETAGEGSGNRENAPQEGVSWNRCGRPFRRAIGKHRGSSRSITDTRSFRHGVTHHAPRLWATVTSSQGLEQSAMRRRNAGETPAGLNTRAMLRHPGGANHNMQ